MALAPLPSMPGLYKEEKQQEESVLIPQLLGMYGWSHRLKSHLGNTLEKPCKAEIKGVFYWTDLILIQLGCNWPMCLQPAPSLLISHIFIVAIGLVGPSSLSPTTSPKDSILCLTTIQWVGSTCPQKAAACRGSQPSQSFTSTRTPWSRRSSAARRYPLAPAMCSWKRGKESVFLRGLATHSEAECPFSPQASEHPWDQRMGQNEVATPARKVAGDC